LAVPRRGDHPPFARRFSLFLAFSPLLLPLAITRIDGYLSVQTAFGYLTHGIFRYDVCAQLWGFFFTNCIVMIIFLLLGLAALPFSWTVLVDLAVALIHPTVAFHYWNFWGQERAVHGRVLAISPLFHVVPAVSVVVLIAIVALPKLKRD
jgi:uncharacterized membrane protein YuzA (DUF378 family)